MMNENIIELFTATNGDLFEKEDISDTHSMCVEIERHTAVHQVNIGKWSQWNCETICYYMYLMYTYSTNMAL